jgi:hypothetical protein
MNLMKLINQCELAIDIGRFLSEIYQKERNFERATAVYEDLHQLCLNIIPLSKSDSNSYGRFLMQNKRLYSKYFMVAYYGAGWGPFDKQIYIYKENSQVSIEAFIGQLKAQYEKHFFNALPSLAPRGAPPSLSIRPGSPSSPSAANPANSIEILRRDKIQVKDLDPKRLYLQVAEVEIFLEPEERQQRLSQFSRNFNVTRFIVESQFLAEEEGESIAFSEHKQLKPIPEEKPAEGRFEIYTTFMSRQHK